MSLPVEVIDAMVAAGATVEVLAAAVKAHGFYEAGLLTERRAKEAAKKRAQRAPRPALSQDVPGTRGDIEGHEGTGEDDASSPKENPHTPIEITPSPILATLGPQRGRELFAEFKGAYPRRDGSQPWAPAEKKFLAATGRGPDAEAIAASIIRGARAYAESVAGADPQFTAQAVTWLNQRRWQDEHPPARGSLRNGKPMSNKMIAHEIMMKRALEREQQAGDSENTIEGTYTVEPPSESDDFLDDERH